jgi:hypothetical protein
MCGMCCDTRVVPCGESLGHLHALSHHTAATRAANTHRGVTCFAGDEAAERLAAAVRGKQQEAAVAGAGGVGGAAGAGAAGGQQGVLFSKKTAPPVVPNPR